MEDDFDHDSGRSSPLASLTVELDTDFDDVTERATAVLSVIRKTHSESEVLNCIRMLQKCIEKENGLVSKFLETTDIHKYVYNVLKHLSVAVDIQKAGFTVLFLMCEHSSVFRDTLVAYGIHSFLIEQLKDYNTNRDIQYYGIATLAHLLAAERFRDQLLLDKQEEDVAHVICVAIQTFPEVRAIECAALRAISYFLTDNDDNADLRRYFIEHVCDCVIEALRKETETETQIRILNCLFGKEDQQKMTLIERDVHFTLMELCSKYPSNKQLMPETTRLLAVLAEDETVKSIMATNSFIQNGLFGIMELLRLSEKVQRAGLRMMEILLPSILENKNKADEVSQQVVKCVYTAMFTQIEYSFVQVAACRALSVLLEIRPEAHKWIGENSEEKQEPVHTLCVGALLSFRKDVELFVSVCEAIFWIAADNERLCTSLMNKNVHVAIVDGLKRHRQISQAIETGCRALRGLCIFLYRLTPSLYV